MHKTNQDLNFITHKKHPFKFKQYPKRNTYISGYLNAFGTVRRSGVAIFTELEVEFVESGGGACCDGVEGDF